VAGVVEFGNGEQRLASRWGARWDRVFGGENWDGKGAVEASEKAGFGGEFDFPALAGDDVHGAGGETDAHAASYVAEQNAHQCASTTADEQAVGVTFVIVFLLDNFPFGDFHVIARLAVRIDSWPADGDNAHLDGDEAAVELNSFEREIHVGLATEERKILGFLNGTDDAVDAGAGGENDPAVESDWLGKDGNEGIAFAAGGTADGSEKSKVDLGPLNDLPRLGGSG
jgi:hypothetical protein